MTARCACKLVDVTSVQGGWGIGKRQFGLGSTARWYCGQRVARISRWMLCSWSRFAVRPSRAQLWRVVETPQGSISTHQAPQLVTTHLRGTEDRSECSHVAVETLSATAAGPAHARTGGKAAKEGAWKMRWPGSCRFKSPASLMLRACARSAAAGTATSGYSGSGAHGGSADQSISMCQCEAQ